MTIFERQQRLNALLLVSLLRFGTGQLNVQGQVQSITIVIAIVFVCFFFWSRAAVTSLL